MAGLRNKLDELTRSYPWPREKPAVAPNDHGFFNRADRKSLQKHLTTGTRLVVELGSWLGASMRWMLDSAPNSMGISVDHWRGSDEHQDEDKWRDVLPVLYETFVVNCWNYRHRLVAMREDSTTALSIIHDMGFEPDLLYIDAAHDYEGAYADISAALKYFPKAAIVGDDWSRGGVKEAVRRCMKEFPAYRRVGHGPNWELRRK